MNLLLLKRKSTNEIDLVGDVDLFADKQVSLIYRIKSCQIERGVPRSRKSLSRFTFEAVQRNSSNFGPQRLVEGDPRSLEKSNFKKLQFFWRFAVLQMRQPVKMSKSVKPTNASNASNQQTRQMKQ